MGVAQWTHDQRQAAGHGTRTLPAAVALYVPLAVSGRSVGVIGVLPDAAASVPRSGADAGCWRRSPDRRRSAFERGSWRSGAAAPRSRSRPSDCGLRCSARCPTTCARRWPRSRAPRARCCRTAGPSDDATRRELAGTIVQESQRMSRLVANLLDMIRVETGALEVQKEWQLLSDVAGVALLRTEAQLRGPSGDHRASRRSCRWCRWTRSCWSRCSSTCWRTPPSTRRPDTPIELGATGGEPGGRRLGRRPRAGRACRARRSGCSRSSSARAAPPAPASGSA